jgi:hypothetical protein
MFDYDSWGSPQRTPGRRRLRKPSGLIVAALLVVVAALIVAKPWQSHSTANSTASGSTGSGLPAELTAGQLEEGACIDPTTSTATSFAQSIKADLASAVASLGPAGSVPTSTSGSGALSQPQSAVSLWIRQVDTASLSTLQTPYTTTQNVPGYSGLAAHEPPPGSNNYASTMTAWSQQYGEVSDSRKAAQSAARKAAQAVTALPLDDSPQSRSAISACVSGLLLTVPKTGPRSFLIASDLQENEAPQLSGSFNGSSLVIIQACDSGSASYCDGNLAHFESEMKQLHVGTMTVVRPEDAGQAITQWVHGEAVTA